LREFLSWLISNRLGRVSVVTNCVGSDYIGSAPGASFAAPLRDRSGLRLRQCGRDAGFRLLDRGAIVIVNQLRKNLALVHALVILNRKLTHVARNLRGYRREVRVQVGIVRSLPPGRAFPTRLIRRYDSDGADGHDEYQDSPGKIKSPIPIDLSSIHGSNWVFIPVPAVALHVPRSATVVRVDRHKR
jgi:hypothetical protein